MKLVLVIATFLSLLLPVEAASPFRIRMSDEGGLFTRLQIGSHKKSATDKATMLFFPGYSDQMRNHLELFEQLNNAGIRVVSFDYPQHGGSTGAIWAWSLKEMAYMADNLMALARAPVDQPVILAGWSTGGTIVTRMLQVWQDALQRQYKVGGAILLAPGLPIIGHINGGYTVTERTLSRGRIPHRPYPRNASNLFTNNLRNVSRAAWGLVVKSRRIPVVVFTAGRDMYVDTPKIHDWIGWNIGKERPVHGIHCRGAYHGLMWEPDGIGYDVRNMVVRVSEKMSARSSGVRLDGVRREVEYYVSSSYSACR